MFKKFIDGLIFGCGFTISFIALWLIASLAIMPMIARNYTHHDENKTLEKNTSAPVVTVPEAKDPVEVGKPFHELSIEEQIQKSSVIALARYEKAEDGKMRAIIKEFLKKDADVVFHYNIGDEYQHSSYYPNVDRHYGDGVVIFFVGSPASMKYSTTYRGNRISGLADLPIELFREKCQASNA